MRERVEEQPKTLGLFFGGGGGGSAFDFRRTWGHQASSSLNKLGFIKSNNFWGGGGVWWPMGARDGLDARASQANQGRHGPDGHWTLHKRKAASLRVKAGIAAVAAQGIKVSHGTHPANMGPGD